MLHYGKRIPGDVIPSESGHVLSERMNLCEGEINSCSAHTRSGFYLHSRKWNLREMK